MIRLWQENGPNHSFLQRRRTSSGEATIQKAVFHTDASETAKGSYKQKQGRSDSRRDRKWKEWNFRGSWWLFKRFPSSCFRLLAVSNQQAWDFRLISRFHTRYNRFLIGTEVCVDAGSHQTGSCWNLCPLNPSPPPSGGGPLLFWSLARVMVIRPSCLDLLVALRNASVSPAGRSSPGRSEAELLPVFTTGAADV